MNGLDLFSGIGGLTKALEGYVRPIAYCESDRYCQAVLLSRMADGELPNAPIWDDIRTLSGTCLPNIDIIYGGFPCQDISCAGTRKGLGGERSKLFFEVIRLAREIKPAFLFLENVPAIRTKGLGSILNELADCGYDCRWNTLPASEVGMLHKRERWFLLAHANSDDGRIQPRGREWANWKNSPNIINHRKKEIWASPKSSMGGRVHGIPYRMDRLRTLGNAVVPQQAREAFERLIGVK